MSDRILVIESCEECKEFPSGMGGDHQFCKCGLWTYEDENGIYQIPDECPLKRVDDYTVINNDTMMDIAGRGVK